MRIMSCIQDSELGSDCFGGFMIISCRLSPMLWLDWVFCASIAAGLRKVLCGICSGEQSELLEGRGLSLSD